MPPKKIKAVFFDLGETLLNFGRVKRTKLFRQAAKLTYDFLRQAGQKVGNFEYYFWRNFLSIRSHYLLSWLIGRDFNSLDLIKKIGRKRNLRLTEDQWLHLAWLWYEPLYKLATVEPDVIETLTRLKDAGLKLGIISNTFVHAFCLDRHLNQLGLLDFFPVRLYSYNFPFRKPDSRIFLAAADQIGLEPFHILYVGDRLNIDIKGALSARMNPVLKRAYTNDSRKVPQGVFEINALSELSALIKRINEEK